jgi:hypothetical protein
MGHWGLDIIPAFICNSKALVVILSRHSAHSKQVHLEIDTYPDSKPVWFISVAGEPLSEGRYVANLTCPCGCRNNNSPATRVNRSRSVAFVSERDHLLSERT